LTSSRTTVTAAVAALLNSTGSRASGVVTHVSDAMLKIGFPCRQIRVSSVGAIMRW
jgi:hypothetical protein